MTTDPAKDPWADRRGLFQRGKEVHEPGRKMSGAGVVDAVRRASMTSNTSETAPKSVTESTAQRRRSSGVPFENLTTLKRGSQDYGDRRSSHSEQHGDGGMVSGWFNKTFRGMQNSTSPVNNQQPQQQNRRGVME